MEDTPIAQSLETPEDLGVDKKALARRWKLELKLADKREAKWRKTAEKVYKLYTPDEPDTNSFNILWPNTETLRQAVYNSLPEPQCRRRFSDEDPLGKEASDVLTRVLSYLIDCSNFDDVCKQLVLGMLLPGRAVAWERYVPKINTIASENPLDEGESYEQVEWEQSETEKVAYDDFRILCAAKCWDDVTAIARRHRLNRQDLIEKFGEDIGNRIKLDAVEVDDKTPSEDVDLFKTATVWEIWDKETKTVLFISESLEVPCAVQRDELNLSNFFPTPKPLYAIENDSTLEPSCLYTQYEQQARELNRISNRINKLVDALRVRGIYDATLTELSQLTKVADNNLIPAQNARALIERGGLDKAIWMMPIDQAAMVLKELYVQRDATKMVIYEISGISDIMRSSSDPRETFGAQKIKTQWGTQRLQRMQREVQRYIRDLIRLKAEVVCNKFQPETIEAMSMVKLPHLQEIMQQKQMALMQYQQQAMMAQAQGQQPPPPPQLPPDPITWEAVVQELQNNISRSYRIDIETDSTLAATQDQDMESLRTVITGIVEMVQGIGPAVQAGAVPVEAVKALIGVVVRRARLGTAVEDAFDKVINPPPQANPEQIKAQAAQQQKQMELQMQQQFEQQKLQSQMQIEQAQMQADIATEQAKAQAAVQAERAKMEADAQVDQLKAQIEIIKDQEKARYQAELDRIKMEQQMQIEMMKHQMDLRKHSSKIDADMTKAELDAAVKLSVAQMNSKSEIETEEEND